MGHQNREAMAYVGVRVEPPVRLGREVEAGVSTRSRPNSRADFTALQA